LSIIVVASRALCDVLVDADAHIRILYILRSAGHAEAQTPTRVSDADKQAQQKALEDAIKADKLVEIRRDGNTGQFETWVYGYPTTAFNLDLVRKVRVHTQPKRL